MVYDDVDPWPTDADGAGSTLALINAEIDNIDPSNWIASGANGTPGWRNAGATWIARYFDPVTGGETPIGTIRANAAGRWHCPAPPGAKDDWVLVLEAPPAP